MENSLNAIIIASCLLFPFVGILFQTLFLRRLRQLDSISPTWVLYVESWRRYPWFLSAMFIFMAFITPIWYICRSNIYCFSWEGTFVKETTQLNEQGVRVFFVLAQLWSIPSTLTLFLWSSLWNSLFLCINLVLVIVFVSIIPLFAESEWSQFSWGLASLILFHLITVKYPHRAWDDDTVARFNTTTKQRLTDNNWKQNWFHLETLMSLSFTGTCAFIAFSDNSNWNAFISIVFIAFAYFCSVLIWWYALAWGNIRCSKIIPWRRKEKIEKAGRHSILDTSGL